MPLGLNLLDHSVQTFVLAKYVVIVCMLRNHCSVVVSDNNCTKSVRGASGMGGADVGNKFGKNLVATFFSGKFVHRSLSKDNTFDSAVNNTRCLKR